MAPNIANEWLNWDDQAFVLNNPSVTELSGNLIKDVFSSIDANGGYTPLVLLSWSLDYTVAGYDSHVFHATNVLLHVANVGLVFMFILMFSERLEIAVITALLFGIHPTQVEPVAWVTARKDLLYAFFYIGGLIAYLKYLQSNSRDWKLLVLTWILFLSSLFSKGMAVSFSLVLVVIDIVNKREDYGRLILEKLPFFVLSILFGLVAVAGQGQAGAVDDVENISFFKSFFVACYGLVVYVFKSFLPIHLSPLHPYPFAPNEDLSWYILASIVPALIIVIGSLIAFKRRSQIAFGLLFFLCTIALMLQFFPVGVAIVAERFTYVASIGIFYLIAFGANHFADQSGFDRRHFIIVVSVYLGILALITLDRTSVWKNSETLWTDVIRKYPSNFLAYNNRAGHFASIGEHQLALDDFGAALELQPNAYQVYKDRGFLYLQTGNFNAAYDDLATVVAITPNNPDAYSNRGLALLNMKRYSEAISDFDKSIQLEQNNPLAYFNRGLAFGFSGNKLQAINDLDRCLSIDSGYKPALEWKSRFQQNSESQLE